LDQKVIRWNCTTWSVAHMNISSKAVRELEVGDVEVRVLNKLILN